MFVTKSHQLHLQLLCAAAFALGSAGAQAATANAAASGTVVAPIAISAVNSLAFGSFAPGAGGTVTISTSGMRAAVGAVLMGASAGSAARFDITGEAGSTYVITHSGSTELSNGSATMVLTKFSDLTGANGTSGTATAGTLDAAGAQSLFVGGTLAVSATQATGVYTGTVIATVEYN